MTNTLLSICLLCSSLFLSSQNFENTRELKDGQVPPKADLNDVSWIQGHWKGEAMGGQTEEIWSAPTGGSMMGSFKLMSDGKVKFYEILTISSHGESLIMRLKHFHQDLKGWEEKDDTVDFELIELEEDKAYFDGLTFEKVGKDELNVYVILDNEGEKSEARFSYRRVSTFDPGRAKEFGGDDYGMKKYVMAFLKRGTNQSLDSVRQMELQRAHLDNIVKMAEEGKLVLAGPFFGQDDLRGIYIFNVETIEEAEALTNTDPAIREGVLVMELREWYGSAALMGLNEMHNSLVKKKITDN